MGGGGLKILTWSYMGERGVKNGPKTSYVIYGSSLSIEKIKLQIDIKPLLNDISRREKPLNTSGVSIEKEYSSRKSLSEIFQMADPTCIAI